MFASIRASIVLLCLLAATALPGVARAQAQSQKTPAAAIVVIDTQRIFREAASLKAVRQQIDQYRAGLKPEIEKQEDALRQEDQELAKQRSVLTPDQATKFDDTVVQSLTQDAR